MTDAVVERRRYTVSAAPPGAARDAVTRVWRDNLDLAADADERFAWVYERAPRPPSRVYLLLDPEGSVVGTSGIAERRVHSRSGVLEAGQLVDLAVDRAHRSLFPALTLVRRVRRDALASHDFVYGFPNAAARGLHRRVGYREIAPVTRWVRVLRHGPYVRERLGAWALPPVAGVLLDVALGLSQLPRRWRAGMRFWLERVEPPDARFDALWERARDEYELIGERSSAFLAWRFADPGVPASRIFALRRRGSGQRLFAYAVVQWEGEVAHLRDLFGHHDALGPLLALLLPLLRAEGARSASVMLLGPRPVRELLQSHGFVPRERERIAFVDAASPALAEQLADADRWTLSDADDDV
jgi:GNAT superfamily N-acetyltransferase